MDEGTPGKSFEAVQGQAGIRLKLIEIVAAAQSLQDQAPTPEAARLAQSIASLSASLGADIGRLLDSSRNAAQSAARSDRPALEPGTAAPLVAPKSVLIADDNQLNLELVQQMLVRDGHRVTAVQSGREALLELVDGSFDVVMLDFNMSDIDGLTVCQLYRSGKVDPAPVFFITADTSAGTASKLDSSGAAGVLYKPMTFNKLRGAMSSVFPGDQVTVRPGNLPQPERPVARLAPVPVEHVDPNILDTLREIKDQPEFIHGMIGDGIADIEQLLQPLSAAILAGDLAAVHQRSHAMKGVAVSIGAHRLGAVCERLTRLATSPLQASREQLCADLQASTQAAVSALNELRMSLSDNSSACEGRRSP